MKRDTAHRQTICKGCKGLSKGMLVDRQNQDLVKLLCQERVVSPKNVPHVRGIEASAEDADAHRPLVTLMAPAPQGAALECHSIGVLGRFGYVASVFERAGPFRDPVAVRFGDAVLPAERGEPLAITLLAAGTTHISRSPKLHRPRGPYCMRGSCDGCLARVDGRSNTMLCLHPATEGAVVERQNHSGPDAMDIFAAADLALPKAFDHHHFLAAVPLAAEVMQPVARYMAGQGTLPAVAPDITAASLQATTLTVPVAIVGAGHSGLALVRALRARRVEHVVFESQQAPGGAQQLLREVAATHVGTSPASLPRSTTLPAASDMHLATTVVGGYPDGLLAIGPRGAILVRAERVVLATGTHDAAPVVPNADLPGVMSARGLCEVLRHGLLPRSPLVIAGAGRFADALASRFPSARRLVQLTSVEGGVAVTGVSGIDAAGKAVRVEATVIAYDGPPSGAIELAAQLGLPIERRDGGFFVGRSNGVSFAIGSVTGRHCDDAQTEAMAGELAALTSAAQANP